MMYNSMFQLAINILSLLSNIGCSNTRQPEIVQMNVKNGIIEFLSSAFESGMGFDIYVKEIPYKRYDNLFIILEDAENEFMKDESDLNRVSNILLDEIQDIIMDYRVS